MQEPTSYAQAKQFPEWIKVMELKLDTLEHNHTWHLITWPPGKRTSKWV